MALLELKGVTKNFAGEGKVSEVLQNVDLTIEEGEFVALVGYSGAGKSTLVSLIAGLLQPDAGTITFRGKPITAPGPDRGVVFQNYSLLPWLSVHENVMLAVEAVFGNESLAERNKRVAHYVKLVSLDHATHKKPGELSGGMRQRVALARALAMEPELLLLDEPLSALDALTRANLQQELARICSESGKTIFLVTNDVDEGILLADRIVPLGAGPAASLGESVAVDIARPRDRKELNHDPTFKAIRGEIIEYLLGSAKRKRAPARSATPELVNPVEVGR